MPDSLITNLGQLTAVGQGNPKKSKSSGSHTLAVTVVGTGALAYAGVLMGSNDNIGWTTAATLSASGSDNIVASASVTVDYAFWRHDVTTLTGTGATCMPVMSTDPAASTTGTPITRTGDVIDPASIPALQGALGGGGWLSPGIGALMGRAVEGLPIAEDFVFGASASPTSGIDVSEAITTLSQLPTHFRPLEGEFDADGTWVGGTGLTSINSEPQRYRTSFDGQNHIMDSDGLRLQNTVNSGVWNSYVRGSIVTTGAGLNVNAPGGAVTTTLAALGLTTGDLSALELGDVWTGGTSGLMVVTAYDSVAQTLTFEGVSSGSRVAYKGNWHVTGTKMAFRQVATDVINGTTTVVTFTAPLPSQVVPGCFVMGVDRGANPFNDPSASDRARVHTISSDRLTVTFDSPLSVVRTVRASENDGLLFMPETWAGQIWTKRSYGPHREGKTAQAIRVEFTMPAMPTFAIGNRFNKADIEAAFATAPGTMWGYWPAIWTYTHRPGHNGDGVQTIPGARLPWSEIDLLEVFTRVNTGQNVWTGNLHDQPYTRRRNVQSSYNTITTQAVSSYTANTPIVLNESCDNVTGISGYLANPRIFIPAASGTNATLNLQRYGWRGDAGSRWVAADSDNKAKTANSLALALSNPLCSGVKRSVGIVWTRDSVIHYLDDIAVCESEWSVDTDYPHQLGINVAAGSLTGGNCSGLFFPQTTAQAADQFIKVHRITTWER